MHVSMTLPQAVIGPLRTGAYLALRGRIEQLEEIMGGRTEDDRLTSPIEPYGRVMQVCGLLDALGWSETEVPPESMIDVSKHGGALAIALDNALKDGLDDLDHPDHQVCEQVREAMRSLCGFAMVIDGSDLELSRSHPSVKAFHANADELLMRLDRRSAECS